MATNNGDERVLATAQHIVEALGKNENMTEDMLRILSNFDDRFSNMNEFIQDSRHRSVPPKASAIKKVQESLDLAEETILRWDMSSSEGTRKAMIWDGNHEEAIFFLKAVDEVQSLMGVLTAPWVDRPLLDRAQQILQVAMIRLKEEFRHMLVVNSEPVDPDWLLASQSESPFYSSGEGEDYYSSVASDSSDDEDDEDIPVAHPVTDLNVTLDLIPSERVRDLNVIAQRMVAAGYGKDSCQVYVSVRKTILEQNLYRLIVERLNLDDIQKITWELLEVKIRKWIQALKVAIKVILASERKLSDKIFTGLSPWRETCFAELATGSMMQFLNFGKAVASSRRTPEKLFKILDMYDLLRDLIPDIEAIFCDEICESVRAELTGVIVQLGEAARGTLKEFENAIQRDATKTAVPGGAFHPLTRYVMNYIKFMMDYTDTLMQLLGEKKREVPKTLGVETFGLSESLRENGNGEANNTSPFAVQIMWLIVLLESNLDLKSKLYKDPALAFLFLMNNIYYIILKVKNSELIDLLGDDWVRKHSGQVRVYAANYVNTAWKKVFACLRDESGSLASGSSRVAIKDRFRNFNAAFEEACRAQSTWVVPDAQLREDLRVAIAERLIPAYRMFVCRFGTFLESGKYPEKYMKYAPDDLENYVIDLFDVTS